MTVARTRAPTALLTTLAVAALVAVAAVVLALRAQAAAADIGGESGGSNAGGSYSAWAYYTAAEHGDTVSTPQRCTLETERARDLEAYYEWFVMDLGDGSYLVAYTCTAVMFHDRHSNLINGFQDWEVSDTIGDPQLVRPAPIEDLVARAIDNLDPTPPAIATDLDAGVDGLVHVPVQFRLTGDLGPQSGPAASAGPISVVLTATPDPNVPIDWHTGDGPAPCEATDARGFCTHDYGRSSYGQRHEGLPDDHYRVTAGITYGGHYDVLLGTRVIASADIGNVDRTVELGLPVDDGQAINTRG